MPEISLFMGIRITINYSDHMPPHFHARYCGENASIDLRDLSILAGNLPKKQLRLVLAWAELHIDELMQNWELAVDGKPLNKIRGF